MGEEKNRNWRHIGYADTASIIIWPAKPPGHPVLTRAIPNCSELICTVHSPTLTARVSEVTVAEQTTVRSRSPKEQLPCQAEIKSVITSR